MTKASLRAAVAALLLLGSGAEPAAAGAKMVALTHFSPPNPPDEHWRKNIHRDTGPVKIGKPLTSVTTMCWPIFAEPKPGRDARANVAAARLGHPCAKAATAIRCCKLSSPPGNPPALL